MSTINGIKPYESDDKDSKRIFWSDGGVHQNITFPVHPDPISGMHCWHQKVRIEVAHPEDKYGDIFVDTDKSFEVYKEWLSWTRPAPRPLLRALQEDREDQAWTRLAEERLERSEKTYPLEEVIRDLDLES